MTLMDRHRHDIAQKPTQLDEERLWCQREDTQVPDFLTLDAPPDPIRKQAAKVLGLQPPVTFFVIAPGEIEQFEIDGLGRSRVPIGRHRREYRLSGNQRLVLADTGAETNHVGSAILVDT